MRDWGKFLFNVALLAVARRAAALAAALGNPATCTIPLRPRGPSKRIHPTPTDLVSEASLLRIGLPAAGLPGAAFAMM